LKKAPVHTFNLLREVHKEDGRARQHDFKRCLEGCRIVCRHVCFKMDIIL